MGMCVLHIKKKREIFNHKRKRRGQIVTRTNQRHNRTSLFSFDYFLFTYVLSYLPGFGFAFHPLSFRRLPPSKVVTIITKCINTYVVPFIVLNPDDVSNTFTYTDTFTCISKNPCVFYYISVLYFLYFIIYLFTMF